MVEYNLDSVVREHIIESLEGNMAYYPKVLQIMKVALREANYRVLPFYSTVEVFLDSTDSFIVPDDYIAYTRIYTIDSSGRKRDLGLLNDLYQKKDYSGRTQASNSDGVNKDISISSNYNYDVNTGLNYGGAFGLTNQEYNPHGYYKEMDGYIAFSQTSGACILMDYMSNKDEVGDNTMVHPYIIETLKSFCLFKMAKSPDVRQFFKKEYRNESNRAKILFNSFNISELKSAIRHAYTQTIKR